MRGRNFRSCPRGMSCLPHLLPVQTRPNLRPLSELLKRGIWTHSSNWSRCLELPALPVPSPFHLPYWLLLHPYPHPSCVMSGVRASQALLDRKGDHRSVVHLLISLFVTSECTALLGQRSVSEGFRTVASARALRQPA